MKTNRYTLTVKGNLTIYAFPAKKSPPPRAQQTSSVVLNIHFNHSQISTKTGFEIHTGCKFNHIKKKENSVCR